MSFSVMLIILISTAAGRTLLKLYILNPVALKKIWETKQIAGTLRL